MVWAKTGFFWSNIIVLLRELWWLCYTTFKQKQSGYTQPWFERDCLAIKFWIGSGFRRSGLIFWLGYVTYYNWRIYHILSYFNYQILFIYFIFLYINIICFFRFFFWQICATGEEVETGRFKGIRTKLF